jgi:hypothetical protein
VTGADLLRAAADQLERRAARTTGGDWRTTGLLATRPEVVAHRADGSTEHVAEARAASAGWITALSPAVAVPLVTWLREEADRRAPAAAAVDLAHVLLERLPDGDQLG